MSDPRLQHLENMTVRQARINDGDTSWYVTTANGFVVSEPFAERRFAESELEQRRVAVEEEAAA